MEEIIRKLESIVKDLVNYHKLQVLEDSEKVERIEQKKIQYNPETRIIKVGKNKRVLTVNECIVIQTLLNSDNLFCTNDELCQHLYEGDYDEVNANALRQLLQRLRKKLDGILILKTTYKDGVELCIPIDTKKK